MASTYLTFTQQTPTTVEAQKFTLSMWVKKCANGAIQGLYGNTYSNTHRGYLYFDSSDRLNFFDSSGTSLVLSRVFRDTNAWYHIVLAVDTTQSSDANKVKFYINGELYAGSYSTAQYPNNNQDLKIMNTTNTPYMGRILEAGTSYYLDGILSHVHFTQGYVYQASDFGETDSTTGEWKIKTSPSIANYGTNGFWWLKDSIATTDHSPNSNTFSVSGGTLTKSEDNPSNVFATLSPHILPRNSGGSISNGNLFFGTSAAQWTTESSAFGITNGKYYFEVKLKDNGSDRRFRWGLQKNAVISTSGNNYVLCGTDNPCIGYRTGGESATQGGYLINNTDTALSDGDINENNAIYGFAIDLDNQRMYGHFNGTWLHSGNPSAGTGGIDVSSFYTVGEPLFPSFTVHNSNIELNFGNGYFGTTAVATNSGSGYQDADGNGIFNYTVPTNYRCFSTKGLNQ